MNGQLPSAQAHRYDSIAVGMKVTHDYCITREVYDRFLAAFRDYSPVHVDDAFARTRGFDRKVMHGSILNGFVSHFVGMHFPGRNSLLLSVDLRFSNACYLDDLLRLDAVVAQKTDARQVIVLDITLFNRTRDLVAARGRVQVMLQEEA